MLGAAIAAQGDVDIIPEPGAQGDMPPPPKLGNAGGEIGIVKVGGEIKAKALGKTDGHVGVAGKVEIQLETVEDHSKPGGAGGHGGKAGNGRERCAQIIGNENLFSKANQEHADARAEFGRNHLTLPQLRCHILVLNDGTGGNFCEERDIQGEIQKKCDPRISRAKAGNKT